MKPNLGIADEARHEIAGILARVLADEYVLYTKTRSAHWNVSGPDFPAMHTFFERQYFSIDEALDEVAERIRALGHDAPGSLSEVLQHTSLREKAASGRDSRTFVSALLADHETIILSLREQAPRAAQLGDDGTTDLLTGLIKQHEKTAWMLRASLPCL